MSISIYLPIYLSIYRSIHLSIYQSINQCIYQSTYQSINLSIYPLSYPMSYPKLLCCILSYILSIYLCAWVYMTHSPRSLVLHFYPLPTPILPSPTHPQWPQPVPALESAAGPSQRHRAADHVAQGGLGSPKPPGQWPSEWDWHWEIHGKSPNEMEIVGGLVRKISSKLSEPNHRFLNNGLQNGFLHEIFPLNQFRDPPGKKMGIAESPFQSTSESSLKWWMSQPASPLWFIVRSIRG